MLFTRRAFARVAWPQPECPGKRREAYSSSLLGLGPHHGDCRRCDGRNHRRRAGDGQERKTGSVRTATANEQGIYFVTNLSAAPYSVSAVIIGFARQEFQKVEMQIGQERTINFTLGPEGATQPEWRMLAAEPQPLPPQHYQYRHARHHESHHRRGHRTPPVQRCERTYAVRRDRRPLHSATPVDRMKPTPPPAKTASVRQQRLRHPA